MTVDVAGDLISKPYVAITTNLMQRFGVTVAQDGWRSFRYPRRALREPRHDPRRGRRVDGLVLPRRRRDRRRSRARHRRRPRLDPGRRRVRRRARADGRDDRQRRRLDRGARGDARSPASTIDCIAIPDAAMTLAVVALFARGPTTLTGIASWRVKETDRIAAMATELAQARRDSRRRRRPSHRHSAARLAPATIDTYDDHRIAMCFSLAAFGGVAVRINDPDCVRKTFPGYFAAFRARSRCSMSARRSP